MRIKNRYQSRLTLVVVLSLVIVGTAKAQSSSDIPSDSLFQPDLIRYLKEGRIDAFQTSDVAGVFYAHGVYMRGIGRCPKLKTTDIPLSEIYILRDIKNFIRLYAFDPTCDPVSRVMTSMRAQSFLGQGIADIDVIIANSSCQAQYTRAVIGAAETINVERVKQMRKDQARLQQDRRRADAARRTERERKAFYEQKLRKGRCRFLRPIKRKITNAERSIRTRGEPTHAKMNVLARPPNDLSRADTS